jgi:hypothetical protein
LSVSGSVSVVAMPTMPRIGIEPCLVRSIPEEPIGPKKPSDTSL